MKRQRRQRKPAPGGLIRPAPDGLVQTFRCAFCPRDVPAPHTVRKPQTLHNVTCCQHCADEIVRQASTEDV